LGPQEHQCQIEIIEELAGMLTLPILQTMFVGWPPPALRTAGAVFCEVQARSYGRLGAVVVASPNPSHEGRTPTHGYEPSRPAGVRPELG
jgi:hypothetical protein